MIDEILKTEHKLFKSRDIRIRFKRLFRRGTSIFASFETSGKGLKSQTHEHHACNRAWIDGHHNITKITMYQSYLWRYKHNSTPYDNWVNIAILRRNFTEKMAKEMFCNVVVPDEVYNEAIREYEVSRTAYFAAHALRQEAVDIKAAKAREKAMNRIRRESRYAIIAGVDPDEIAEIALNESIALIHKA